MSSTRQFGIYMLDVGQGDATVILPPEGEGDPIVFDCRDDHVVHKLLTHWGRRKLHAVVISHLDWDHIAGVLKLLERDDIETARVYLNVDRDISDDHPDAQAAKVLIDCVIEGDKKQRWTLIPATVPDQPILEGQDWSVEILAPRHRDIVKRERADKWEDPNVLSAVLRVRMNDNVVLIGGDAPLVTWAELADRRQAQARVLRVPHHGGALADGGIPSGWDVQRLYREINPQTAIVSVGTSNRHTHPIPEWIEPASSTTCTLLCTQVTPRCQADVRGDIDRYRANVLEKKSLIEADWWHLKDRYHSGLSNEGVPCAATVVVTLFPKQMRVRPLPRDHEKVIDLWDEPLCGERS